MARTPNERAEVREAIAEVLGERLQSVLRDMGKTRKFRNALALLHELISVAHRSGDTACPPLSASEASKLRRNLEWLVRRYSESSCSTRESVVRSALHDEYKRRGLEPQYLAQLALTVKRTKVAASGTERGRQFVTLRETRESRANDFAWSLRWMLRELFEHQPYNEAECGRWFGDFYARIRMAKKERVTKIEDFTVGQLSDIPMCIWMRVSANSVGWLHEVRRYLYEMLKLKKLEPRFLAEVSGEPETEASKSPSKRPCA